MPESKPGNRLESDGMSSSIGLGMPRDIGYYLRVSGSVH